MTISRPLLKNNAKVIIRTARPSILTAGLIFLAVSILLGFLSSSVLGVNMTADDLRQYMNYYLNGDYQALIRLSESMTPPATAYLLNLLIQAVLYIVGAGFLIFILNTVNSAGAVYGNLLDGFGLAAKLILLALLEGLFIFLWSLLFLIPGIIAVYRYRMAKFLLLDHPEMGVTDCIRVSKQMMKGHKWECFVLDLSFLGWRILAAIPYIGYAVSVWTIPYINTTYVLYYMALAGKPVTVGPAPGANPYV
ncbi:MAG: DUF975 family protein [Oscillospiraceae bacterium]|nr:DUF975 family protein [Oscillospiraceae bacterium]